MALNKVTVCYAVRASTRCRGMLPDEAEVDPVHVRALSRHGGVFVSVCVRASVYCTCTYMCPAT